MAKASKKLYGYFGHHKCASTWFIEIFANICLELGLHFKVVNRESDFDGDLCGYIRDNGIDFIAYSNADYSHVAKLRNLVGIHAVRDPRDIVVSAYFSHLKTHSTATWPELEVHRALLGRCDQPTGLFHEIEFRRAQFDEMRSWRDYQGESIMQVRMEDVTSRTYQSMLSIVSFLGLLNKERYSFKKRIQYVSSRLLSTIELKSGLPLPRLLRSLPAERVLGIVWENEFARKAGGREPGEENADSHYRKGIQGDWKNYLSGDHLQQIRELHGDVITQYGYDGPRG